MHYANQTVIITGASSGIGRALAIALANQGARVGVIARRAEMLAELVDKVRATGGTIEAAPANVANREELRDAVQVLTRQLGPVDLLIANVRALSRSRRIERTNSTTKCPRISLSWF